MGYKYNITGVAVVTLFVSALPAFAVEGLYLNNSVQAVFLEDSDVQLNGANVTPYDYDTGFGFGAALGYRPVSEWVRYEGELLFQNSKASQGTTDLGEARSYSLMLNLYLDAPVSAAVSPYAGAGLGLKHLGNADIGFYKTQLAWQVMAGASYTFASGKDIYAGYRYMTTLDFKSSSNPSGALKFDHDAHVFEIGYRIPFSTVKEARAVKTDRVPQTLALPGTDGQKEKSEFLQDRSGQPKSYQGEFLTRPPAYYAVEREPVQSK